MNDRSHMEMASFAVSRRSPKAACQASLLAASAAAFAAVLRNPSLRRAQLSLGASSVAEFALGTAVGVYAVEQIGARHDLRLPRVVRAGTLSVPRGQPAPRSTEGNRTIRRPAGELRN